MPILIIFASKLVHQIEGVLIKKYDAKHAKGGFIFTAIVSLFAMLFFLVMEFIQDKSGVQIPSAIWLYGIFAGICFCLASFLTYVALGCGSFVLSRLILSYSIIITIIHGLFLGETISVFGWIGIVLIIFSLYFVKGNNHEGGIKITKKWIITITLSVLFSGIFGVLQRQQQIQFDGEHDREFMIVSLAVSGIVLLIAGLIKDGKDVKYILKNGSLYALGAGVSNGATNLLTLYVYTIAPMSIVAPTGAGAAMLISFLISKVIFKEKFSWLQYVGVILGGASLILFNL